MYQFNIHPSSEEIKDYRKILRQRAVGPSWIYYLSGTIFVPVISIIFAAVLNFLLSSLLLTSMTQLIFWELVIICSYSIFIYMVFRDVWVYLWNRFVLDVGNDTASPYQLQLSETHMTVLDMVSETHIKWSGVGDIVQTQLGVMLMVDRYTGYYLPFRYLSENQPKEEIINFIQQKMETHSNY